MSEGDDIRDRYAGRFGDEDDSETDSVETETDESTENEKDAGQSIRDEGDMNVKNEQGAGNSWNEWNAENVKQDWKGWTVYLPEPFLDDVRDESKLLDVRLDRDVKMDRHFKPLLIALGKERLEGMEDEEVTEFMERMERGEL